MEFWSTVSKGRAVECGHCWDYLGSPHLYVHELYLCRVHMQHYYTFCSVYGACVTVRVIGTGTDVGTDCREPHHMLGIRSSLSGRAAMHLHPGLACRASSRAHKGTAYSETREPCCTRQTNCLVFNHR